MVLVFGRLNDHITVAIVLFSRKRFCFPPCVAFYLKYPIFSLSPRLVIRGLILEKKTRTFDLHGVGEGGGWVGLDWRIGSGWTGLDWICWIGFVGLD